MIIKSMSRKEGSFRQLIEYMHKDRGEVAFAHNLCGNPFGTRDDIILEFERNAEILRGRKNGNTLYHEVISLEAGTDIRREEIIRILGEIGREYVARRAPNQIAFGMVHTDAKHVHLHICLSANAVGKDRRERLSRQAFAGVQKDIENLVRDRYRELGQTAIYGKDRGKERLKTTSAEQEMRKRSGEPSRKEDVKTRLHQVLEGARSTEELVAALRTEGLEFYQRGKTLGVIDALTGRKHRLSTLGAGEHYEATMARLFGAGKGREEGASARRREEGRDAGRTAGTTADHDRGADRREGDHDEFRDAPKRAPMGEEGVSRERAAEHRGEPSAGHGSCA